MKKVSSAIFVALTVPSVADVVAVLAVVLDVVPGVAVELVVEVYFKQIK